MEPPIVVGPGDIVLEGDHTIDLVVYGTNLTVIDGKLTVITMEDNVNLITQIRDALTGADIIVHKVEGKGSITSSANVILKSDLTNPLTINAKNNITARDVASYSQFSAETGGIIADDIYSYATLSADAEINVKIIKSYSHLQSFKKSITAWEIQNFSEIRAAQKLIIEGPLGSNCAASSLGDDVVVGEVSCNTAVLANVALQCTGNIGTQAAITSLTSSVDISGQVHDGASVRANNSLHVAKDVGISAALFSVTADIKVKRNVAEQALLFALTDIIVTGDIYEGAQLRSLTGAIEAKNVRADAFLNAVTYIKIEGDIGPRATLNVPDGIINIVGTVSKSANLIAKEIYINGEKQVPPCINSANFFKAYKPFKHKLFAEINKIDAEIYQQNSRKI